MLNRYCVLLAIGTLAACATVPEPNQSLEKARVDYESIQTDPQVIQYAPAELSRTDTLLKEAQQAWAAEEPDDRVEHLAYLTSRQSEIARETAKLRAAEAYIARADLEQAQAELDERTRQAQEAQRQAELALAEARLAQQQVAQTREAELAAELERAAATERERTLRQELGARDTERGLTVTLSGLLFDPNRTELLPDAMRSIDKLAEVLTQYPERKLKIEGFADGTGSDEINRKLSEQRAEAVRQALVDKGVDAERIEVEGLGAQYPVASNDTSAGRQLNRRVEVILLDEDVAVGGDTPGTGP